MRKTADELLAELEQKPEFVERQRERMAEREENRRRYAAAAAGLLADLEAAGFSVETLAQLRQRGVGNRGAVSVLVKWLPAVEYLPLKRDLIATLGSPWARPDAARPLVDEFRRVDPREDTADTSVRWSIGDALARVADESVLDDLIEIATDATHGHHRALVLIALGNMGKSRDRVLPVLLAQLDDDVVAPYAVMGLGKLKAPEARAAVERFVDHPESWVRNEAKKALAKLPA
ncbi:MAG: HEAT repeat domain-containing protein [Chloroflexota bacterium]|nr:HEAT repeat domain-containing protein [Chloroflexota bacterium]